MVTSQSLLTVKYFPGHLYCFLFIHLPMLGRGETEGKEAFAIGKELFQLAGL